VRTVISVSPATAPFASVVDYVGAAEAIGIDCCWVQMRADADPVAPIAELAAASTSIQLGTGVLPISSLDKPSVARIAATLAHIAERRFILGLGAGTARPNARPVARMRETVGFVRETLGELGPPIYVGALAPRMLSLTGAIADGWLASTYAPSEPRLSQVRDAAAAAGRASGDIDPCVPLTADATFASALDAVRRAGATSVRITPTGTTTAEQLVSLARAHALCS
jgi:alkanesulfonate monooxygenase SsuD/methylene tetrahydromethanopterin reductase-like flavin-dependent oxidoreductase (luciferase family)